MKNERIGQYLMIYIFLFLIWLPIVDNILRTFPDTENLENRILPHVVLRENRPLATISEIRGDSMINFPKKFENYYNDNFGFRTYLIKANNILNVKLFSVSPNTNIILGKEDWLYYAGEDKSIFKYKTIFEEKELKSKFDILKDRKELYTGQGVHYFIVIAPDKQSIYHEYMPEYIQKLNENSNYDHIADYLSKNSLDINIDVKKALLKEKKKKDLTYYKTDTHWNVYGAFIAYQEIMKKFKEYYPELEYMSLTDFNIVDADKKYSGDLANMLGMQEYFEEKTYKMIPKNNRKAKMRDVNNISGIVTKKPMLLSECDSCDNVTIMVIRDSFTVSLIPFLNEHFSKAIYISNDENPELVYTIIMKVKPNIVLFEKVERGMNTIFYQNSNISSNNITIK